MIIAISMLSFASMDTNDLFFPARHETVEDRKLQKTITVRAYRRRFTGERTDRPRIWHLPYDLGGFNFPELPDEIFPDSNDDKNSPLNSRELLSSCGIYGCHHLTLTC
jgi:hypothetical protein